MMLFDEMSEKLYSLAVQKRQFQNYLKNLKVLAIPSCQPLLSQTSAFPNSSSAETSDQNAQSNTESNHFDVRYYNELMDSIPSENVSIPIVMHCMIEQVMNAILHNSFQIFKV